MPERTIKSICFLMRMKSYKKDSVICRRGDLVNYIFFVIEGVVEIQVPYNMSTLHFDFLPPGSCFGLY